MVDYVATRAQQQQAVMGIQFNTVGIEFTLSDSIRDKFVESANQAVRGSCHATIYQVLTHLLRSEFQIGPFASDDVIRFALWKNTFAIPENLDSFVELISGLEIGDFNEYRDTLDAEMQDKSKTLENITHQIPEWEINSAKDLLLRERLGNPYRFQLIGNLSIASSTRINRLSGSRSWLSRRCFGFRFD